MGHSKEGRKKYVEANREKIAEINRRFHLKRKYGITLEQYNEMLEKQNHCCAVCGKHKDLFPRKYNLAVDHDHKTLEIFGLLCYTCNHYVIGRYRNPALFAAAAKYLEKGTGLFTPPKVKKKRKKCQKTRRKSP